MGVLNESNILDVSKQATHTDANTPPVSDIPKPETSNSQKAETLPPVDNSSRLLEQFSGQEDIKIVLTEGKYCFIKYPKNVNERDVLILKKWIELLELTVQ